MDWQTVAATLVVYLLDGGPEAAKEFMKGAVANSAAGLANAWKEIFGHRPESYPLADQLARDPKNEQLWQQLQTIVGEVLAQHPELMTPQVQDVISTGNVTAGDRSVAVGVAKNTTITMNNN